MVKMVFSDVNDIYVLKFFIFVIGIFLKKDLFVFFKFFGGRVLKVIF